MFDIPDILAATPGLQVGGHPEPDGDQPMSAAELRMAREHLGLTSEACAQMLGLYDTSETDPATLRRTKANAERRMRRYELSGTPIPESVREGMELLERVHQSMAVELITQLHDARDLVLTIPAGDTALLPGGWWRSLAYEVTVRVPGLHVRYADGA